VLVEFKLDEHRKPFESMVRQSDPWWESAPVRLNEGALKVVQGMQFDPADHTKPNPKLTYRVTVIFCLQPGNCDRLVPFPQTTTIIVVGGRINNDGPRPF
jgi:hypothetical protein